MAGPSKKKGNRENRKPKREVYFRTGIDIFSFKPVIIKHLIQ